MCVIKLKLVHTLCVFKQKFAHTLCTNKAFLYVTPTQEGVWKRHEGDGCQHRLQIVWPWSGWIHHQGGVQTGSFDEKTLGFVVLLIWPPCYTIAILHFLWLWLFEFNEEIFFWLLIWCDWMFFSDSLNSDVEHVDRTQYDDFQCLDINQLLIRCLAPWTTPR